MTDLLAGTMDNERRQDIYTAPTGGVTRGLIYEIEDTLVACLETVDAAADFTGVHKGEVAVTKLTSTGQSFAKGDKVYVDASTKKAAANATSNALCGIAREDAVVADTVVLIELLPLVQDLA